MTNSPRNRENRVVTTEIRRNNIESSTTRIHLNETMSEREPAIEKEREYAGTRCTCA